jgi:hypothetical protein
MIEHEMSELELILEQEQPDEPGFTQIEYPEDSRYLFNPELGEIYKAVEEVQQETPAEVDARYQRDLDRQEVEEAVRHQQNDVREKPVLPEIRWVL